MEQQNCAKCSKTVADNEDPVFCKGACDGVFHRRCTSLKKGEFRLLKDNLNLCFRCDACVTKEPPGKNADETGGGVCTIDRLNEMFKNFEEKISARLEKDLQSFRKELERDSGLHASSHGTSVDKRQPSGHDLQVRVVDEPSMVVQPKLGDPHTVSISSGLNLEKESTNTKGNMTWSTLVKKNLTNGLNSSVSTIVKKFDAGNFVKALPAPAPVDSQSEQQQRRLVIIPKASQSCAVTRTDIRTKVDPRHHQLSDFRNGGEGHISVKVPLGENLKTVKDRLGLALGEAYTISLPMARMKLVGMTG